MENDFHFWVYMLWFLSLWPWGLILFSFVLNALSYIRDCTLFMAKGVEEGGGGEGDFKISGNGGFIFQMQ